MNDIESSSELSCEMLVLGGGPGGYSAAFRSADLGMDAIIVERYPTLGGVCLNVGCIPSKTLLHVAESVDEARDLTKAGISFPVPLVNRDRLRAHTASVIAKLTNGLAGLAKARKVRTIRGVGKFVDQHHLEVEETSGDGKERTGKSTTIAFRKCIIAAGSESVHLPFLPEDPRIVDSTGALQLPVIPERMLVIGGGIIGLEMATVYSSLGAVVDIVESLDRIMPGPDRDLIKVWEKKNSHRFGNVMLKTKAVDADARDDGIWIRFAGENAPVESQRYDLVLQSVGRSPNGKRIMAEKAGVEISASGFIPVNKQMQTNVQHVYAIGDIVGQPMLAHKAIQEGHVAAEAASGLTTTFDPLAIPCVAYTHPEVAWVGIGEDAARQVDRSVSVGKFPWAACGRAIANGADYGFTKLIFDAQTNQLIGGSIVGHNAGDIISEVALAIQNRLTDMDIAHAIHPHPTLGETVGLAAEEHMGRCTDLPAQRKR